MNQLLKWLSCLAVGLSLASLAQAADPKDQTRALQQRLRALEQEKAKLNQGKTEAESQAKASTEKLVATQKQADAAQRAKLALARQLEELTTERAELTEKFAALEKLQTDTAAQLEQTKTTLGQTALALQRSQIQGRQLTETVAARDQSVAECTAKNMGLYQVGSKLLQQINQSGWGAAYESEPLTQLRRVQTENKLEDYREAFDQFLLIQNQEKAHAQVQVQPQTQRQAKREEPDIFESLREQVKVADAERTQKAKAKELNQIDRWAKSLKKSLDGFEW